MRVALGSEQHKDTKERILDAAELLFAERGFDATSLRGVTAEARVNLAAVNYHFGSKAALLRAVVRRILAPANAERLRALGELEAGGRRPPVEELIEAFVSPVVGLLDHDGERGRFPARLLGRILGDPDGEIRRTVIEETEEVEGRYQQAFARTLTHLPEDELRWRFRSMIGVLVSHLSGALADPRPPKASLEATPEDGEASRHRMVTFLAAALRAPATLPQGAEPSS